MHPFDRLTINALHDARHVLVVIKCYHDALTNHLVVNPDALPLDLLRFHQARAWAVRYLSNFARRLPDAALVHVGLVEVAEPVEVF